MTSYKIHRNCLYALIFLLGFSILSCNEDDIEEELERLGFISLSTTSSFDELLWDNISLTLYTEEDVEVISYSSLNEVPDRIEVPEGSYYIVLKSDDLLEGVLGVVIFEVTDMIQVIVDEINEVAVEMAAQARYVNIEQVQDGAEGGDDVIVNLFIADSEGNPATNDFNGDITVNISTSSDADFTDLPSSATIASGSTSTEVTLLVEDDTDFEPNETITVTISNTSLGYIGISSAEVEIIENDEPTYCNSQSTDLADEWIDGVFLEDINNVSGSTNYSDFTNISTDLVRGNNYTLTVDIGVRVNGIWTETVRAWIDYNYDGDFDDADEQIGQFTIPSSVGQSGDINFTVPSGTSLGTKRMRISQKWSSYATSCQTYTYGEVEDYNVEIVDSGRGGKITRVAHVSSSVEPLSPTDLLEIQRCKEQQLLGKPTDKK